jgi:hypothetical protein
VIFPNTSSTASLVMFIFLLEWIEYYET